MRTYNEDHRDLPNAYREARREAGQDLTVCTGTISTGAGILLCAMTIPAGILLVLGGIISLVYGFTYYKK